MHTSGDASILRADSSLKPRWVVCRSLLASIQGQVPAVAWRAARVLAHLASLEGCPVRCLACKPLGISSRLVGIQSTIVHVQVMSLINGMAIDVLLKLVRESSTPGTQQGKQPQQGAAADSTDRAGAQAHSAAVLLDLAWLLRSHGLASQAEVVHQFAEVVGEVARSPFASGALRDLSSPFII